MTILVWPRLGPSLVLVSLSVHDDDDNDDNDDDDDNDDFHQKTV